MYMWFFIGSKILAMLKPKWKYKSSPLIKVIKLIIDAINIDYNIEDYIVPISWLSHGQKLGRPSTLKNPAHCEEQKP